MEFIMKKKQILVFAVAFFLIGHSGPAYGLFGSKKKVDKVVLEIKDVISQESKGKLSEDEVDKKLFQLGEKLLAFGKSFDKKLYDGCYLHVDHKKKVISLKATVAKFDYKRSGNKLSSIAKVSKTIQDLLRSLAVSIGEGIADGLFK